MVVGRELTKVLAVGGTDLADRRHTQSDEIAFRMGRIALKASMQMLLALRDGQPIIYAGKVIHN